MRSSFPDLLNELGRIKSPFETSKKEVGPMRSHSRSIKMGLIEAHSRPLFCLEALEMSCPDIAPFTPINSLAENIYTKLL